MLGIPLASPKEPASCEVCFVGRDSDMTSCLDGSLLAAEVKLVCHVAFLLLDKVVPEPNHNLSKLGSTSTLEGNYFFCLRSRDWTAYSTSWHRHNYQSSFQGELCMEIYNDNVSILEEKLGRWCRSEYGILYFHLIFSQIERLNSQYPCEFHQTFQQLLSTDGNHLTMLNCQFRLHNLSLNFIFH